MLHAAEPVRYVGLEAANTDYHDGQLRPVIGVHSFQVLRANRAHPEEADDFGWTYNHAPMLAYWNGKFYLEYLSNPVGEHGARGQTLLVTSPDGRYWEKPIVVFPVYPIPDGCYRGPYPLAADSQSIMHQRMGFYQAPDGRLLVLGFYGCCPTPLNGPNDGWGIGRVVREIYHDGSFSPIFFIRYNRHAGWDESNTRYPYYRTAPDRGFVDACDALLANRLATLQWWEEDQSPDRFYAVEGYKALSYYHLPDGRVMGLWKNSKAAISDNEGLSWSPVADVPSLVMSGAKIWGQRTSDGRYALVYNPSPDGEHRWPLACVTSADGVNFDDLRLVNGEVPPRRYAGTFKDFGQNYVRGIEEGTGLPPDGAMWVAYSMNKEDIWVSRIPAPLRWQADAPVDDDFNDQELGGIVAGWNVYSPAWCPISVVAFPGPQDRSLELRDEDPYDYARAERVFPESVKATVELRLMARHTIGMAQLQLEIVDGKGNAAVQILFDADGGIKSGAQKHALATYDPSRWNDIRISVDAVRHRWDLAVDGKLAAAGISMRQPVRSVERLVFRTGPRRREPTLDTDRFAGEDLPGAGERALPAVWLLNAVRTSAHTFAE